MIKPKILLVCITIIITFFILTCSIEKKDILDQEKFIDVLSEIMVLERLTLAEEQKIKYLKYIFEKYQTNAQQFLKTKEYYKQDPEFWITVYDKAKNKIKNDIKLPFEEVKDIKSK